MRFTFTVLIFDFDILSIIKVYLCIFMVLALHAFMLNCFSCVQLFVTLLTVAYQAPLSMGFTRQEH